MHHFNFSLSLYFFPCLTSPLLLHASLAFLLSPSGLLYLLMLATLVKVFHHNTHKHVENEEADDEEEGDEVEQHPWVVVNRWLEQKKKIYNMDIT